MHVCSYLANRVSRQPNDFDSDTFASVNFLFRLLPLTQLLLIYTLYFRGYKDETTAPFVLGLAIWVIFAVAPLKLLLGNFREKEVEDGGTQDCRCDSEMSTRACD